MGLATRFTSTMLGVVLVGTMVPIVPAYASDTVQQNGADIVSQSSGVDFESTPEIDLSAESVSAESPAPMSEFDFVFDKSDFYVEASADDAAPYALTTASAYGLEPLALSDEMKYFAKYESGFDYDHGLSSFDGYNALGFYQFDRRYGLRDFLLGCYEYDPLTYAMFEQFEAVSDQDFKTKPVREYNEETKKWQFSEFGNALNDAWHAAYAANPYEFAALQDSWAYDNYYLPAQNYLASRGIYISDRADCVKGLCWGLCNLFGSGGWRKFVGGVTSGYDWDGNWHDMYNWPGAGLTNDMNDIEFVTTLCNYVIDNVAVFYKMQPEFHQGWQNRYKNELQDCLGFLGAMWVRADNGEWQFWLDGAPLKNQWYKTNKYWSYFDENGYASRGGWDLIDGVWYFFDNGCYLVTNSWIAASNNTDWYYVKSSGARACSEWVSTSNGLSYFNTDGIALRNTRATIDGSLYFFNSSCYAITNEWILDPETSDYYYTNDQGAALVGKHAIGSEVYIFDQQARMLSGFVSYKGETYYLNDKHDGTFGAVLTGWRNFSKGTRYFNTTPGDLYGCMARGWFELDGARLYFDPRTGFQQVGWVTIENGLYLFNLEDGDTYGELIVGWLQLGPDDYRYLKPTDPYMGRVVTGWHTVDGYLYYFDPTYGSHLGYMLHGWMVLNGIWYYLNPVHDGTFGAASQGWDFIDNTWYYFYDNASLASGWMYIGGAWYYLNPEHDGTFGAASKGWDYIDGSWYYFYDSCAMASGGWIYVDGYWYYLTSSGRMDTGWLHLGGTWYYLGPSGDMKTGWRYIDGDWYYFASWGGMVTSSWVGGYYVGPDGRMW